MSKSQTRMAAKQEVIELLKALYDEMHRNAESLSVLQSGAFVYGTLNGIALARLEIETKM